MVQATKYDIFLSYSRRDEAVAKWLNGELQARGVRTFLDQKSIDPGALFEQNIFDELRKCRSYGLILTRNSLNSDWVQREYACANEMVQRGDMRIIPLLFEALDIPVNLSLHNVLDFRDAEKRTARVNSLVFPGITGKTLHVWMVNSDWSRGWTALEEHLSAKHGIFEFNAADIVREWNQSHLPHWHASHARVVAIVNLFGSLIDADREWRIKKSAQFIFDVRERTRGTESEVVFVLFQDPAVMARSRGLLEEAIGAAKVERLRSYFQIDSTRDDDTRAAEIDAIWNRLLQELMTTEHRRRPPP
jgi:hypothetical protein